MISVVVPCYNEEENVEDVYKSLSSALGNAGKEYEILFVDDGSKDSTKQVLDKIRASDVRVVVVPHDVNKGLGKALETGFKNSSGSVIVTTDADSTHDPSLIPKMAELVETGNDVVIGSRYVSGGKMLNVPFYRVMISKFAGFAIRLVFGMWKVKDTTSGYRAYSRMVKKISVDSSGFQSEVEILYKMNRLGAKITEIPIVLEMRKKGNSKFRLFRIAKQYAKLVASLRFGMK